MLVANLGQNERLNGPNFSVKFDLTITFEPLQSFQFRFHGWPTLILIFPQTPITIYFRSYYTIPWWPLGLFWPDSIWSWIWSINQSINQSLFSFKHVIVFKTNYDTGTHEHIIGVYGKVRKNIDHPWKQNWKNGNGSKVMAKSKYTLKLGPFYFVF